MDNNKINFIANFRLSVMTDSGCCYIIFTLGYNFRQADVQVMCRKKYTFF